MPSPTRSLLFGIHWTSISTTWTNFHGFPSQTNVCRGCGKKFNTEELVGFHEKECVQCRPHRWRTCICICIFVCVCTCISTRRGVLKVDLLGETYLEPRLSFYLAQPYLLSSFHQPCLISGPAWSSVHEVSSRSSNNGMFRCEFCGQGFIVAARLKHHRRSCQVLIKELLNSSKSQLSTNHCL